MKKSPENPSRHTASLRARHGPTLILISLLLWVRTGLAGESDSIYLEPGKTQSDYRNVAMNPNEVTNTLPATYPHATSNSEYNQRQFAACRPIDSQPHDPENHNSGSWGPQKRPDAWWRLDFGRAVQMDKLGLTLRADWATGHDSYWQEGVVEFSDGSALPLNFQRTASPQTFAFAPKTVRWLVLKALKPAEDKWCGLCRFEAWGRDAVTESGAWSYVPGAAFARALRQDPLVDKAIWAMLGFKRASWEQGVAAQALLEAGEQSGVMALAYASLTQVNSNGIVAFMGGSPTDPLMLGDALWWAAHQSNDPRLLKAAEAMLNYALKGASRAGDQTPYHTSSRTIWSDGSFTSPPFLAAAGHGDEAVTHLRGVIRRLWDPEKKLVFHIWSEDQQHIVGTSHWGGGNGWTAAALARVIRSLPPDHSRERAELAGRLRELLDGCLQYQRPDGLFYDEPDRPDTYVETNLGAMLSYAIYESVRGGWLPESYLAAADRMRAAVRTKVDQYGFVQGVAGAPTFQRPGVSAEGQAFFILMEAAARKARNP